MQFQNQVYITKRFIHQTSAEKLVKDELYLTIYLTNTAILNIWIFNWRYHFRLWVFASTGEYFYYWHWQVLPNVLQSKWMPRPLKTLSLLICVNHVMYLPILQTGSFGFLKLNWFRAVYYQISVRSFLFAKGQAFESNQSVYVYIIYSQNHPKRTSTDMELRNCWYGKQKQLFP